MKVYAGMFKLTGVIFLFFTKSLQNELIIIIFSI